MAKCYVLSVEQAQRWESGGFEAWHVEDDVVEFADAHNWREPVVVILPLTNKIAFALTAQGVRA